MSDTVGRAVDTESGEAAEDQNILRVGDEIEYYSPMFVAGDSRGLRRALIEKIDPDDDEVYPVRLNRFELLPVYTYVSRTTDLDGNPCSRRYQALSSYALIPGFKSVPRQERTFVAAMRKSVSSAVEHVLQAEGDGGSRRVSSLLPTVETEPQQDLEERRVVNAEDEGEIDPVVFQTRRQQLRDMLTRTERDKRQRKGRDRLGLRRKSKKRIHQIRRKATTDGSSVILPRTLEERSLRDYLLTPSVQAAIRKEKREGKESS